MRNLKKGFDRSVTACELSKTNRYMLTPERYRMNTELIQWNIDDYLPGKDPVSQFKVIEKAANLWAEVLTPIKVLSTKKTSESNIQIFFASDSDLDDLPPEPFGPSSTLAYAYFPQDNYSEIWIDKTEDWNLVGSTRGIPLLVAVLHEFGHSLGFGHSRVYGDIMYPSLNPRAKIAQDSKNASKDLYGDIQQRILDRTQPEKEAEESPEDRLDTIALLRTVFPRHSSIYTLHFYQIEALGKYLGIKVRGLHKSQAARNVLNELFRQ